MLRRYGHGDAEPAEDPRVSELRRCRGNPVVSVVTAPTGGAVTGDPFVYTPAPGFVGVDHFRYTVTNTTTGEASAEATVNLVVDRPPTCADGAAVTTVGEPVRITFSAFPCADPDGLSLLIHTGDAAHGTVVADLGGREVTYTPDPGFAGTDQFDFSASDNVSLSSPIRTMRVTVTPAATPTPAPAATPAPTSTPPPPAPVATTAPRTTPRSVSASIAKGVSLRLASDEAGTAKLTLSVDKATARRTKLDRKAKGRVKIGTRTAKLANGSVKVKVKLTAKARKALKAVRRLKAKLTVVATDAAGNSRTTTRTVVLKK